MKRVLSQFFFSPNKVAKKSVISSCATAPPSSTSCALPVDITVDTSLADAKKKSKIFIMSNKLNFILVIFPYIYSNGCST